MRIPFIAGNWKMYKTVKEAVEFIDSFKTLLGNTDVEVAVCVPFTHLWAVKEAVRGTKIKIGAQNMHYEEEGAFTGEVSPLMLREIGVDYCIIGHSERRQYFSETDESVNKKLHKAFEHGIVPILCVGETLDERDAKREFEVVKRQMKTALTGLKDEHAAKLVVAYEPVWAIGTGRNATPKQANEMIGFIRQVVSEQYGDEVSEKIRIQYGGSVKPSNASDIMNQEEIDGALVGGASLNPEDFIEIVNF